MIAGMGTDIVNIERVAKALEKFGSHFLTKIFTTAEQEDIALCCKDAAKQAAKASKIFAAKEAAVKALGTGFNQGISWQEIEIGHDDLGKPLLKLSGKALERAKYLCGGSRYQAAVSLSDDYPFAQAVVIIENL